MRGLDRKGMGRVKRCEAPGCEREAHRRLCWAHSKQKQRGHPLTPVRAAVSPLEQFIIAGNELVEAESDAEWRRALRGMARAGEAWLRARGWSPPPDAPAGEDPDLALADPAPAGIAAGPP